MRYVKKYKVCISKIIGKVEFNSNKIHDYKKQCREVLHDIKLPVSLPAVHPGHNNRSKHCNRHAYNFSEYLINGI